MATLREARHKPQATEAGESGRHAGVPHRLVCLPKAKQLEALEMGMRAYEGLVHPLQSHVQAVGQLALVGAVAGPAVGQEEHIRPGARQQVWRRELDELGKKAQRGKIWR